MILHFLLAVGLQAKASSYYIQPFSQFTHEASAIVQGRLSNIHTENGIATDGAKVIYTYATIEVKEVLKGSINPESTTIRELGGTKDGATIAIPGTPELKEGEEAVFFLGPENSDQTHDIHGLELGKFGVEDKNGESTLTGGLFNFSKQDEHTSGDPVPENQHNWTLKELKATIEKQGGKNAPPLMSSTPNTQSESGSSNHSDSGTSMSAVDPHSPPLPLEEPHASPVREIPTAVSYGAFGLAAVFLILFFFRKRR